MQFNVHWQGLGIQRTLKLVPLPQPARLRLLEEEEVLEEVQAGEWIQAGRNPLQRPHACTVTVVFINLLAD